MRKNSLSEFELEHQDFKIKLKRGVAGPAAIEEPQTQYSMLPPVAASPLALGPAPAQPASSGPSLLEIKSPMIGTFYRAPSPESSDYVEIGSEVNPDTVV